MFGRYCWVVLVCALVSCSGGGGSAGSGGGGRTKKTGVRIIHGALDTPPVSVWSEAEILQTARFGESTSYVNIAAGQKVLSVRWANSPTAVVRDLAVTLEKDTEYTIFLYGGSLGGSLQVVLLTDVVIQPVTGKALVHFMNAYQGPSSISVALDGAGFADLGLGQTSAFVDLASGPHQFRVEGRSGRTVATLSPTFPDQGELTLLVAGSEDLGVTFAPVFTDLD